MLDLQNTEILRPVNSTKSDCVAETIRRAILIGDLVPGQKITEKEISKFLKVSSSPVREAFQQLVAEGLLVKVPYYGISVNDVHIDDPKELYSIVTQLQGMAVRIN